MKKILFFINTLSGGGAEKVLCDLVNNLDKNTFDITVQTMFNEEKNSELLSENIKYKYVFKKYNILNRVILKLAYMLKNIKWFYKLYVADSYDIEVAFLEGLPTKIISFSKSKKIAWVHTNLLDFYAQNAMFSDISENIECYKRYEKIICVSENAKSGFIKRFGFGDKVDVCYNIFDEEKIKMLSLKKPKAAKSNDLQLVTVGRLEEVKGYDSLLSACRKLVKNGFKFNLWIVGDGSQRNNLQEYIDNNNLSEYVSLLGYDSNPYKYIKNSDLYVCSSRVEGFSTVVAESLICGTPVLSTECGGTAELLEDGKYGLLVENSEEGLYNGIVKLISDADLLNRYKNLAIIRGNSFLKVEALGKIQAKILEV